MYGQPLWGRTFDELARRISIETTSDALVLFERLEPILLNGLGIGDQRNYTMQLAEATDPRRLIHYHK